MARRRRLRASQLSAVSGERLENGIERASTAEALSSQRLQGGRLFQEFEGAPLASILRFGLTEGAGEPSQREARVGFEPTKGGFADRRKFLILPIATSCWFVLPDIRVFPTCSQFFTRSVAFTQRGGSAPLEASRTRLNTPTPSSILNASTSPPGLSRKVSSPQGWNHAGSGSRSRQLTRKTSCCQCSRSPVVAGGKCSTNASLSSVTVTSPKAAWEYVPA